MHALTDGRILTASGNIALDCWSTEADERTAYTNVQPPYGHLEPASRITIVDLATGRPTTTVPTTTRPFW
ncbi:hypothetical protein ABZ816_39525 [Actinosynnema sp. NPDC047251]|uniref:Uncharacterized protein n=1 Tax=Saccharothrix espanaensis (strain ATCC 51144 / DSM 44229 / JCM 9112 / NBRC 15066 / NRRL 15764) TaxID=1179773 RepID=K0JPN5_SACES|nr:hypothetical protein [Saccharothrix espanaensis]CCH29010.1 hypothetical protein BN6_16880 [Saccharothrix espanaensis DSM 44229]